MFLTANIEFGRRTAGFLLSAFVPALGDGRRGPSGGRGCLSTAEATWSRVVDSGPGDRRGPRSQLAGQLSSRTTITATRSRQVLDALFASLPAKTAFVRDDYHYNMMLVYKLLGEEAAGSR